MGCEWRVPVNCGPGCRSACTSTTAGRERRQSWPTVPAPVAIVDHVADSGSTGSTKASDGHQNRSGASMYMYSLTLLACLVGHTLSCWIIIYTYVMCTKGSCTGTCRRSRHPRRATNCARSAAFRAHSCGRHWRYYRRMRRVCVRHRLRRLWRFWCAREEANVYARFCAAQRRIRRVLVVIFIRPELALDLVLASRLHRRTPLCTQWEHAVTEQAMSSG